MVRMRFGRNVYGYYPRLLKKVTWEIGSSPLCSQYTSGWICPWAPPKINPGSAYGLGTDAKPTPLQLEQEMSKRISFLIKHCVCWCVTCLSISSSCACQAKLAARVPPKSRTSAAKAVALAQLDGESLLKLKHVSLFYCDVLKAVFEA